jgi:hypothetical protein
VTRKTALRRGLTQPDEPVFRLHRVVRPLYRNSKNGTRRCTRRAALRTADGDGRSRTQPARLYEDVPSSAFVRRRRRYENAPRQTRQRRGRACAAGRAEQTPHAVALHDASRRAGREASWRV